MSNWPSESHIALLWLNISAIRGKCRLRDTARSRHKRSRTGVLLDRPTYRNPSSFHARCDCLRRLQGRRMTRQDKAIAADQRVKADAAYGRAVERARNSPDGLRLTAQGLRDRARKMSDSGDRATMLRLASEYERQATELDFVRSRTAK